MNETKTIRKVLVDAEVVADMNVTTWRFLHREETQEQYEERHASNLEDACKEFHDHCRDHRSLDKIRLEVVRKYEYVCPCGNEFDTEAEAKACLAQDALATTEEG